MPQPEPNYLKAINLLNRARLCAGEDEDSSVLRYIIDTALEEAQRLAGQVDLAGGQTKH